MNMEIQREYLEHSMAKQGRQESGISRTYPLESKLDHSELGPAFTLRITYHMTETIGEASRWGTLRQPDSDTIRAAFSRKIRVAEAAYQ